MDRSFMSNGYSIGVELGDPNLRVAAYSGETDFFDSIALPTRLSAGRDQIVRDMSEAAKTWRDAGMAIENSQELQLERPGKQSHWHSVAISCLRATRT
jgi:hypothetical protein